MVPLAEAGKKIIIIEDGGFHYSILPELLEKYPVLKNAILGSIEQTASGVKRFLNYQNNVPYPVLSVARSRIKMRLEAHFIARRVIDELDYLLYMANDFISYHNVFLQGYGVIGRNLSKALVSMHCFVWVYDTDEQLLKMAKEEGARTTRYGQHFPFMDNLIVVGSTGAPAFDWFAIDGFIRSDARKIYLASASSKRIEFQAVIDFFEKHLYDYRYITTVNEMQDIKTTQQEYGLVYSFTFQGIKKEMVLLANGYPVNFYRKNVISLTGSIIDLIYCQMLSLCRFLVEKKPESKLYLLGSKDLPELYDEETMLMNRWFKQYSLISARDGDIWASVDAHPLEDHLRQKCLV
jgi:hypothetical protein